MYNGFGNQNLTHGDFIEVLRGLGHGSLDLEGPRAGMGVDLALGVDDAQVLVVGVPLVNLAAATGLNKQG
jgi:hypothetical protein